MSADAFLPEGAFEQGLDWLTERRAAALADFKAAGLPTRKTEHWKYTPIRALTRRGAPAAAQASSPLAIEGATIVSGLSAGTIDLGKGAFLAAFSDLTDAQRALVEPRLATLAATSNHAFAALNTALLSDGIALYLPRNAQIEAPIVVEWSTAGADIAPRLLIIADTGSQVTIFERFEGGPNTLTNAVTEAFVGPNAAVHHAVLQTEHVEAFHIGRVEAQVDRDGRFHHGSLNLGAKLARREIHVRLDGAGAETQLHGLFAGHADQHLDQHVHVEHAASRATSNQQFRGILTDKARGVFTGRVLVPDGVKHSTAEQQNPNLLLSETAHVDTRPQLEIYNNDVVASHGATVGRLDTDALFYLMARGIPLTQARTLLTAAFAADVLDAMPHDALRTIAKDWLHAHVIGAVE